MTTMMITTEVESDDGPIWLTSGYTAKELIKQVPGARWDADRRQWSVPLTWSGCKALRGVVGDSLVVGPALVDWAQRHVDELVNPCLELRSALEWDGDPNLFPFQRAGVAFLSVARRAILADEMGTGKTVQASVALRELDARGLDPFPALVIAPSGVKTAWARELARWVPGVHVEVVEGSAVARRKAITSGADVVVMNWETTWRHSRLAGYGSVRLSEKDKEPGELNEVSWRTVIADEAHRMKNPKAKQTRATWWLARTAEYRWALTGTPIANAPDDLWAILHFLDEKEWPARSKFVDRYCLTAWNAFGGLDVVGVRPDRKDEFYACLDPRFRRMPKSLVLPQLPPKVRVVREAPMTTKQAKAYKQMKEQQAAELSDALESSENPSWTAATLPLVQNLRLMQFSSSYAEVNDANDVRLAMPSNKVDALLEIVEEAADEPLVVFAESRQLVDLAAAALVENGIDVRLIVGGMNAAARDTSVNDFQDGKVNVILLTTKAGGEGITLTRSSTLVFLQRSWSMLANRQAEDRVHRIGSEVHESITIIDVIAPGTVEVEQVGKLREKLGRLEEVVRDKETLRIAADGGDESAARKLAELEAEEARILSDEHPTMGDDT